MYWGWKRLDSNIPPVGIHFRFKLYSMYWGWEMVGFNTPPPLFEFESSLGMPCRFDAACLWRPGLLLICIWFTFKTKNRINFLPLKRVTLGFLNRGQMAIRLMVVTSDFLVTPCWFLGSSRFHFFSGEFFFPTKVFTSIFFTFVFFAFVDVSCHLQYSFFYLIFFKCFQLFSLSHGRS